MMVQVDRRRTCCAGRKGGVRRPFAPLNLDAKQSCASSCIKDPSRFAALDNSTASLWAVFSWKGTQSSLQARGSHQLAPSMGARGAGEWPEAAAAREHPFCRAAQPESPSPFAEPPLQRQRIVPVQHRGLQGPTASGGGGGRASRGQQRARGVLHRR